MVLNLIAKFANSNNGSAGPYVVKEDRRVPLRDWLCDSLVPMAKGDARRLAIVEEVRMSLVRDHRKRGRQTADYAACATRSAVCADQFQGMSSSHRAAGQSAAIFPVTSAM